MSPLLLITIVFLLSSLAFWLGKRRALVLAGRGSGVRMHSRPGYYGLLTGDRKSVV